MYKISKNKKN